MEIDPTFASLLQSLKLGDPWTPSRTWEWIPSEGGVPPRSSDSRPGSRDPIFELPIITDASLVRLALHALQGLKSALVEVRELSMAFCSSAADRTSLLVPNLWCWSSSTSSLGQLLKSIGLTGLEVFFLHKFVDFYLFSTQNVLGESSEKREGNQACHDNDIVGVRAPYSLVNQAFAVAVKKVLDGYFCALNTLSASVKLKRSMMHANESSTNDGKEKMSIDSETTLLEIYLHTEELRRFIKSLGNICFPKFADLALSREGLTTETDLEFQNFPRGADLLSYLYVQLRDTDPIHYGILKYLFISSCEPYCILIKSWIYRASVDDPYEEFLIKHTDNLLSSSGAIGVQDGMSLASIKVSIPCFLKDFSRPLLRAGQQLQVLVKLLNSCHPSIVGGGSYVRCDLKNLEEIIPCNSAFLLNSLAFSKKGMEILLHKREVMYKTMLEKLQNFFCKFDDRPLCLKHSVMPFDPPVSFLVKGSQNVMHNSVMESDWIFSTTTEQAALSVAAGQEDNHSSFASDESSGDVGAFESAEGSSSSSSSGELDTQELTMLRDSVSNLAFLTCYSNITGLQSLSQNRMLLPRQTSFCSDHNVLNPANSVHQHYEDENFCQIYLPIQSRETECGVISDSISEDDQYGTVWPLGLPLESPFHVNMKSIVSKGCLPEDSITTRNTETSGSELLPFGETLAPLNSKLDPHRLMLPMNGRGELKQLSKSQSWITSKCYSLASNPILTKAAWLHKLSDTIDKTCTRNQGFLFRFFDFSVVKNPGEVYSGMMLSSLGCSSQVEGSVVLSSDAYACRVQGSFDNSLQDNVGSHTASHQVCSSREETLMSEKLPHSPSGGAFWEQSLLYGSEGVNFISADNWQDSKLTSELPLDVVIDKCIVQEILLQYKYISNFTLKLLEEGFNLHEHLLALRRYHLMELADWADSFIISLGQQKWTVIEPEQKITEIQGLLALALQRSSCDSDPYKERLYVYLNGLNTVPFSSCSSGMHIFDYLSLGYRVDWPINIIITQEALNIYAEIFGYLVKIRLALFSLIDLWRFLKDMIHFSCSTKHIRVGVTEELTSLMTVRHKIYHFVSTLQQYLHSQLSNVLWCQFQNSFNHQVKDVLDFESLHMSNLADALQICFLSHETKSVAAAIKNILQCALDLRLCLNRHAVDTGSELEQRTMHSVMNFSQVSAINTKFEKNVKDLYILYLKSPKHGELSLCHFWSLLNYNDYYSTTINKDVGYSLF